MRSISVVVRRAVAFALAAAPSVALLELRCDSGCAIQWQPPRLMNCMENPWMWANSPIAVGTMSDPAACGLNPNYGGATAAQCASVCGSYGPDCAFAGGNTIYCTDLALSDASTPDTLCGRRPHGLEHRRARHGVGAYLANAAYLEAASVFAFETLREELAMHRAPRSLRRAATRAQRDEQRHARMMGRLARRRGTRPESPRCAGHTPREFVAMAVENVVEGCVRETYGAAVALWQGDHARAGDVRAVMRKIASDEARHADLGWRVAAWLDERLSDTERAAVREAGVRAVEELMAAATLASSIDELGLPAARVAQAMLQHLWAMLWEPAFGAKG